MPLPVLVLLPLPTPLPPPLMDGTIENRTPNGDDDDDDDDDDVTVGRSISWSCPISKKEEYENAADPSLLPLFRLIVVVWVVEMAAAPSWPFDDDTDVNIEDGGCGGGDNDEGGGVI